MKKTFFGLSLLIALTACDAGTGAGGDVTYTVTSSCPTDVTYTVNEMDTQQESDVASGWTKTVPASSLTNTLIAQLKCEGGDVTVKVDGSKGPKEVSSSGDYTVAQVSYP